MQWIDGFERRDGAPQLVVVSSTGERRLSAFKKLRSVAPERRGARHVELSGMQLGEFTECDPQEYLDLLGFDAPVSAKHRVYEVVTPTARLLIPGAVMLLGLFACIWHMAPWLTSAATLDRLAVPSFEGDKPSVTFFPGSVSGGRDKECTQERFLWFTCFPSARATWHSVASNVRAGRLAFDLPNAAINGSVCGLSRGETVLVTRLHVSEVTPTEMPFPYASAIAGKTFRVSPRTELILASRPDTLSDESLPPHASGWQLMDEEWANVSKLLDVRSIATARPRIDEILLKLGTGRAWDDVNQKLDARAFYFRLKRQGRWEQIRSIVLTSRIPAA